MATVTFKGVTYVIPEPGDADDWASGGDGLSAFLQALANNQPTAQVVGTGTSAIAPLYLVPSAEPTGPSLKGALYVTSAGVVKVCTVAGTPGTWVSVGGQT